MNITEIYTGPLFVKTWLFPLSTKNETEKPTIVVIDPGGTDDDLMEYIKKAKPEKLEIMLTHGHFDHIGGVTELVKLYPNSTVRIHEADKHFLGNNAEETHRKCLKPINAERYITRYLEKYEFPNYTDLMQDGEIINGLKVIHTPGHTPGSVCFWSEKHGILFSGDTLFCRGAGRTDLLGGSEENLKASIKKLMNMIPPDTTVYPGHGSNTTIANEIKYY
ncbi:MAG: MBL fold metallo-hydrolase [Treponema sp.]|nr:MAG: MBL fold metallo-hydrolase [Treponema sp.]